MPNPLDVSPIEPVVSALGTPPSPVSIDAPVVDDAVAQAVGAVREVVPEYPTFSAPVASFSPESADALKIALGIGSNDLLVGIPEVFAPQLGLNHGDTVSVSTDGTTIILGGKQIRVVTRTPKGPLTKCGVSKGIRKVTGLQDHRETGTGTAETIPFTVVTIDGEKAVWLKVNQKTA